MKTSHSSITIWSWQENVFKRLKDGLLFLVCLFVFVFSHDIALFIAHTNYTTTGLLLGSGPCPLTMLHRMERSLTHIANRNTRTQG